MKLFLATIFTTAILWVSNASASSLYVAFIDTTIPNFGSFVVDTGQSFENTAAGMFFETNLIDTVFSDTGISLDSLDNYRFSVFAIGTAFVDEFGGFEQRSIITGSNDSRYTIPSGLSLDNVVNNATTFLGSQMFQDSTSVSSPADPGYYDAISFGGNFGNIVLPAESVVGIPLEAFLPEYVPAFEDNLTFNFELITIGQFSLDADGTFAYSPIPVPASVWLLGTGLFALVTFMRKQVY